METSAREVHENMNAVIDYQTHHRLRETQVDLDSNPGLSSKPFFLQGRHRAEDLNERTMIWSVFVTFAIMCVGFGQASFPWAHPWWSLHYLTPWCRCSSWSRSSLKNAPPRCLAPIDRDIFGQKLWCDMDDHVTFLTNCHSSVVICDVEHFESVEQFTRVDYWFWIVTEDF